jgi:hypothetical protein
LRWLVEGSIKGFVCLTLLFAVFFIFIPTFAAKEFVANVYCLLPFGLRCWFLGATVQLNCFVALFLVSIVGAFKVSIRLSLFAYSYFAHVRS